MNVSDQSVFTQTKCNLHLVRARLLHEDIYVLKAGLDQKSLPLICERGEEKYRPFEIPCHSARPQAALAALGNRFNHVATASLCLI